MSDIQYQISNHQKGLALLLDPEKANLDALPITAECHPDYIFVGGSTGGDTTDFIKNLKSKISNLKSQMEFRVHRLDNGEILDSLYVNHD